MPQCQSLYSRIEVDLIYKNPIILQTFIYFSNKCRGTKSKLMVGVLRLQKRLFSDRPVSRVDATLLKRIFATLSFFVASMCTGPGIGRKRPYLLPDALHHILVGFFIHFQQKMFPSFT